MVHAPGKRIMYHSDEAIVAEFVATQGGAEFSCSALEFLKSISYLHLTRVHNNVKQCNSGACIIRGLYNSRQRGSKTIVSKAHAGGIKTKYTWFANHTSPDSSSQSLSSIPGEYWKRNTNPSTGCLGVCQYSENWVVGDSFCAYGTASNES